MSAGHTGKLEKKRGVHVDIEEMAGRKKRLRRWRSLIYANPMTAMSVAEEQPQQNDHRYRNAQQPEQNSSSHEVLLEFIR
jgi:hypothetical protein